MGLVNDNKEILREVVQKRAGRLPRLSKGQVAGIVLDPGTESRLPHHLHVKIGPFCDPLGLQKLILALKECHLFLHLRQDIFCRSHHFFLGHHIVGGRKNRHVAQLGLHLPGQRVDL